ncbi:hypothetical protein FA15DRAFT_207352 [Coprinopsis marcescibilis]|uniref:NACHT domain-containing protein n=1 Tax=Coprinopsis marcescibilis TaxID=230819 RepID=A0A5C3LED7_COPMA|nr:hypothetical protein FA15DRAFT_207352 [Coprinopsis marcescibilis]
MPVLSEARDVALHDCQITDVAGDFIVTNNNGTDGVSGTLYHHIAPGALHDAMERSNAPRCAERTREKLQSDVNAWITRPMNASAPDNILWLQGAAGSGKSAIAQSIAESCEEQGILAATFFFSYLSNQRDNHSRFVSTLAYQLALKIPHARQFVGEAVVTDASAVTKGIKLQMETLILRPLDKARDKSQGAPWPNFVIIIDGLDECQNEKEQSAILEVIFNALTSGRFPFRLLIASRPETEMRKFFSGIARSRTWSIDLNTDYDVEPDIDIYLRASFRLIHAKHQIQGVWPHDEDIAKLVENASGQFVYASTVIKYVDDPARQPQAHLEEVLVLQDSREGEHPLSPLHTLYSSILAKCADPKETVFGLRVIGEVGEMVTAASSVNEFIRCGPQELRRLFDKVHSLLYVPPPYEVHEHNYKLHHKSLVDFLGMKESQVMGLYLPPENFYTRYCLLYFRHCQGLSIPSTAAGDSPGDPLLSYIRLENVFDKIDPNNQEILRWMEDFDVKKWVELELREQGVYCLKGMYIYVHRREFKCSWWKCGSKCRRWRTTIRRQCQLHINSPESRLVLPSWSHLLRLKWTAPCEGLDVTDYKGDRPLYYYTG